MICCEKPTTERQVLMDVEKVEPKSKHGGKRPGSGRKAGTPNKATADIKALAQQFGPEAVMTLAQIMKTGDSDKSRAMAANLLLDRGYGKPAQTVDANLSGELQQIIKVSFD